VSPDFIYIFPPFFLKGEMNNFSPRLFRLADFPPLCFLQVGLRRKKSTNLAQTPSVLKQRGGVLWAITWHKTGACTGTLPLKDEARSNKVREKIKRQEWIPKYIGPLWHLDYGCV